MYNRVGAFVIGRHEYVTCRVRRVFPCGRLVVCRPADGAAPIVIRIGDDPTTPVSICPNVPILVVRPVFVSIPRIGSTLLPPQRVDSGPIGLPQGVSDGMRASDVIPCESCCVVGWADRLDRAIEKIVTPAANTPSHIGRTHFTSKDIVLSARCANRPVT